MRNVLDGPTPDTRLLLLEEGLGEAELGARAVGPGGRTLAQLAADDGLAVSSAEVEVDYRYWPAHTVLQVRAPAAGGGSRGRARQRAGSAACGQPACRSPPHVGTRVTCRC